MNKEQVLLDADHVEKLLTYRDGKLYWRVANNGRIKVGNQAGFLNKSTGYFAIGINGKTYQLHRVIWLIKKRQWPKGQVDHIDGNPINNRIENLRDVSHQENQRNASMQLNNKTGVIGVCSVRSKFRVRIHGDNGNRIHIGYFSTIKEAADARRNAEKRFGYHKNHGRKNVQQGN